MRLSMGRIFYLEGCVMKKIAVNPYKPSKRSEIMKKIVLVLLVVVFVLSFCSCGSETSDISDQPVQSIGYEAPYCPGNFSKIGETFSTFYVAGSGLQYSSKSLYILMVQAYPLIRNGWDAYTDYNGYGSRVGVANDRIVFNVQDLDSVSVAEALPADMLEVEPLIVCGTDDYGNIGELMLIWKGDNGYMVGFTTAYGYPNNSYQNEQVKFFISTVDLAYISNMPAEAIAANPAY